MNSRLLRLTVGCIITAFIATAAAGPAKAPKRMVNQQTVDLSPLFKWSAKQEGKRPLTAWPHITGSIVGTNSLGWVLQGDVEQIESGSRKRPAGKHRFILKNPPLQDRTEFDRLSAQYRNLTQEKATLSAQASATKRQEDALRSGRRVRGRTAVLRQDERQTKDAIKALDQQLKKVQTQLETYPDSQQYAVDCFAMDTGQEVNGMAVYDHGMVLR